EADRAQPLALVHDEPYAAFTAHHELVVPGGHTLDRSWRRNPAGGAFAREVVGPALQQWDVLACDRPQRHPLADDIQQDVAHAHRLSIRWMSRLPCGSTVSDQPSGTKVVAVGSSITAGPAM